MSWETKDELLMCKRLRKESKVGLHSVHPTGHDGRPTGSNWT